MIMGHRMAPQNGFHKRQSNIHKAQEQGRRDNTVERCGVHENKTNTVLVAAAAKMFQ